MSTPGYGIRVVAKRGKQLTLRVLCVAEEVTAPPSADDADFFVRVLCDIEVRRAPKLLKRIAKDGGDLDDNEWLLENASRYFEVTLLDQKGGSPRFAAWDSKKRAWTNDGETKCPRAEFRVTLTDAAFADHLDVGQGWDTAAFASEVGLSRDKREVVAKRGAKPLDVTGSAMISPVGTPRKWSWLVTVELKDPPRDWEDVLDGYGSKVLVTFEGLGTKTARLDAWGSNEIDLEIASQDLTEDQLRANKYNTAKPRFRPITIAPA